MPERTLVKTLFWLSASLLLASCAALLPKSQDKPLAPWRSFEEAKAGYEGIQPFVTDLDGLRSLGFDPYTTPNVRLLNHSQVVETVLPSVVPTGIAIPAGILECMKAQEGCQGYLLEGGQTKRDRVGNFLLDFMNFRRETLTTGWKFSALIVTVHDKVVYKQWSGTPNIQEVTVNRNPLGPLQGVGASPNLYD